MSQKLLAQVLRRFPQGRDPRLLVDASTADDAGVYRLSATCALVQTVDFFTPIVDDPFTFGQIAAANALSDIYAMGGRPITALNLLAVPSDKLPAQVISQILQGGQSKARQANCLILGGHTVKNPEPLYGLSVTGIVHPRRMITNSAARPDDVLILTKPLGTGIATTALKSGKASPALVRKVIRSMLQLNAVGHELASRGLITAGTDITGFGLLGHLAALCRASHVCARIDLHRVPAFSPEIWDLIAAGHIPGGTRANLNAALETTRWNNVSPEQQLLLADAQTSGGLLLAVRPRNLHAVTQLLHRHKTLAKALIGIITPSKRPPITVQG